MPPKPCNCGQYYFGESVDSKKRDIFFQNAKVISNKNVANLLNSSYDMNRDTYIPVGEALVAHAFVLLAKQSSTGEMGQGSSGALLPHRYAPVKYNQDSQANVQSQQIM